MCRPKILEVLIFSFKNNLVVDLISEIDNVGYSLYVDLKYEKLKFYF